MADYYPLIARAVQGLSDPSPPMREAVYGRARAALMDQLRSLDPPLSEEDIAQEGHSLDDAIARVEASYAPAAAPAPAPVPAPAAPAPEAYPEPDAHHEPDPYPEPAPYPGAEPYPEPEPFPEPEPYPEPEPFREPEAFAEAGPGAEAEPSHERAAPAGEEAQRFSLPSARRRPAYEDRAPGDDGTDAAPDRLAPAAAAVAQETRRRPRIDATGAKA
ncbi:histidine kinase, partial [Salinarimonas sp. NSM]